MANKDQNEHELNFLRTGLQLVLDLPSDTDDLKLLEEVARLKELSLNEE